MKPYITIGMLGGIIAPRKAPDAVKVAAYPGGYFALFISGIIIPPTAATVATPEPDTALKKPLAKIVMIPRNPFTLPTNEAEKATILRDIPPLLINSPAYRNKGIAINGKESRPEYSTAENISGARFDPNNI